MVSAEEVGKEYPETCYGECLMAKKEGTKKVRICTCANVEDMEDHGKVVGGVNEGKKILICLKCRLVRLI